MTVTVLDPDLDPDGRCARLPPRAWHDQPDFFCRSPSLFRGVPTRQCKSASLPQLPDIAYSIVERRQGSTGTRLAVDRMTAHLESVPQH